MTDTAIKKMAGRELKITQANIATFDTCGDWVRVKLQQPIPVNVSAEFRDTIPGIIPGVLSDDKTGLFYPVICIMQEPKCYLKYSIPYDGRRKEFWTLAHVRLIPSIMKRVQDIEMRMEIIRLLERIALK